MTDQGTDTQQNADKNVVGVREGILKLGSALEGLPGANDIMKKVATEAVKTGDIKVLTGAEVTDNRTSPEIVQTSKIPQMRTDEVADENKTGADEKKEEKTNLAEKVVEIADDETNPLLISTKKPKDLVFENFDQVKAEVKKEFGIEIKDEKDFGKVFKSSKKWREDAQKVPELQKQVDEYTQIFETMPQSLLLATQAYFNGKGDWESHITSRPKFDFKIPADKQDIKVLVSHYFAGDFTAEDFAATEKPKALQIAEKAAIEKFNADKQLIETASARQIEMASTRAEARKTSITGSLTTLKQSFPDLIPAEEKRLAKILESGDINSLFFNKDGSYRPEAAEMLFMAKYGKDAITKLMKVTAKRAETKANEEILTRGADSAKPEKGKGSPADQNAAVLQNAIDGMTRGLNKKTTY